MKRNHIPALDVLASECQNAVKRLEGMVSEVRESCQLCDENWSPTMTEHVLQVYALLSAELGYKKKSLEVFNYEFDLTSADYDNTWLLQQLKEWICTRPHGMLASINKMLCAGEEVPK